MHGKRMANHNVRKIFVSISKIVKYASIKQTSGTVKPLTNVM